jgi:hypothetical protein
MTPRFLSRLAPLPAVLAALIGLADAARANDRDVRATMIPATSCQLYNGSAFLSNYSWFLLGYIGNQAFLLCPVTFNNIDLSGTSNDNDLTKFRVHYRNKGGEMRVFLDRVEHFGTTSRSQSVCGAILPSTTSSVEYTSTVIQCPHDIGSGNNFYSFLVRMDSNFTDSVQRFVGIDFP